MAVGETDDQETHMNARLSLHPIPRSWRLMLGVYASTAAASAQVPCQDQRLSDAGSAHAQFGASVAASGDMAIVGASAEMNGGVATGAAYVYRRTVRGWEVEQMLLADDGTQGDAFGASVTIDGDVAVVGAPGDDDHGTSSGSAYLFRFDGTQWVQQRKLLPPPASPDFLFGVSVALRGQVAVVGAPVLPYPPDDTGHAFVYIDDGSGWRLQRRLAPPGGGIDQQFGISVATDGQRVVVGARWNDSRALNAGAAYVYSSDDNWTQSQRLLASDGRENDEFGRGVSIDGDTIAVGTPQPWRGYGAVYLFRRSGSNWIEDHRLSPGSGGTNESFGQAVALAGSRLIVGTPQSFVGPGRAYAYAREGNQWFGPWELSPQPIPEREASYGAAVTVVGDEALVGARAAGDGAGSVYVFNLTGDCRRLGDLNCDGVLDAFDVEPFILALLNPAGYAVAYPDCNRDLADVNGDGSVDAFDIEPFVMLLVEP